jgi:hypothetical protein
LATAKFLIHKYTTIVSSRRTETCSVERLAGTPDLGEEFLAEDFGGCSVAEAFAWCGVQVIADLVEIAVAERQWINLSRKPFPRPSVSVSTVPFCQGDCDVCAPMLACRQGQYRLPVEEVVTYLEGEGMLEDEDVLFPFEFHLMGTPISLQGRASSKDCWKNEVAEAA